MFDLFRSRAKAVRLLLGAIMVLVALSMVTYLIPGFGTDEGMQDQVVAEIGDEALSLQEVHRTVQEAIQNQAFPTEMAAIYVPELINQMITQRALAYQASRMGFEVSEADLALVIQSIFPQLYENGEFVGSDVYAAYLAQQNLTIGAFESNLRKQILLSRLQGLVLEGMLVTEDEIREQYRKRYEKIKLDYVAISPDNYRSQVTVPEAELKTYFDNNRAAYQIPENRSLELLLVEEGKVAASTSIPEADLRRAYDSSKENYRTPERVRIRHILLTTTDKSQDEIPNIEAKAAGLLKQLRGGADFAELARANSDDTVTAVKGGDLDWVARGQTVPAFENMAFSLKAGELSEVVKTEYGFHILQVLEKESARLRPFEEVRAQLETERKQQMVYDRMQSLADEARAALAQNPKGAAEISNKLGLQLVKADNVSAGEALPVVGASPELQNAISVLRVGEVSPVVQTQSDRLTIAVLTNITPSRPAELPEVRDQIRQRLVEERLNQIVQQRAAEAMETVTSLNGDLRKLAAAMGLQRRTTEEFGLGDAVDGIGPAGAVLAAFSKNVGELIGPVPVSGQQLICKVVGKVPADMSQFEAQRGELLLQLKSTKARERNELFEEGLLTELIRTGKVKIHQGVVDRLVANYRG